MKVLPNPLKRALLCAWLGVIAFSPICEAQDQPASLAYVLQADARADSSALAAQMLAASDRDWIIIDAAFDGETPWSPSEIETIRQGKAGRKVVAYLSIGEAEDYRSYWRKEWVKKNKPTALAPSWLGPVNPDWKGNYRVKYWQPGWQTIILANIDAIMAQGFDGLYLDIVDGFEFYEQDRRKFIDNRVNPATGQSYRRDMVDWVKTVAQHARLLKADALVIPQNGVQLLEHADFAAMIDAVGVEDLFTNGNRLQSKANVDYTLGFLALTSKPVFDIEYATATKPRQAAMQAAHAKGFVWLLTDRDLETLGTSGN